MSIGRALLIVNPASRRGRAETERALTALKERGVEVEAVLTERQGHARAIAQSVDGRFDAMFTLGGDGTATEVLEPAARAGCPVGVLPGGTGNLLARSLGIPLDTRRAVHALLEGVERRIDLGSLGDGRCFAFAAGVGIDATMIERASPRLKKTFGVGAYLFSGTRAALSHESFELDATVDGKRHAFTATAAMVANFGDVLGGLLRLGPNIVPDDGLLDLCVFAPQSSAQALRLGWRLLRRNFDQPTQMYFLRGSDIRLDVRPARVAQADGELLGQTPLSCSVLPGAARVLAPLAPRRGVA